MFFVVKGYVCEKPIILVLFTLCFCFDFIQEIVCANSKRLMQEERLMSSTRGENDTFFSIKKRAGVIPNQLKHELE